MISTDAPAVAGLLCRGLKGRSYEFWLNGLRRISSLTSPFETPSYGYVLESDGAIVGVVLMIYSKVEGHVRCNLSSWYVDPPFRSLAALMVNVAVSRAEVTYINISPNPSTWKTIEAQGFKRYVSGQCLSLPFLSPLRRCRVRSITSDDESILVDHAALGCLSLVVEAGHQSYPFVFMPDKWNFGHLTLRIMQLIYCREIETFIRFSGPLGRYLLRRGIAVVAYDSNGRDRRSVSRFTTSSGPRYFRGPNPPRLGDLAFCEWVVLGPGLRS